MKIQLVLLLIALGCVQASPLHERNRRKATRQKANAEVRSIVSAIVDAILDGDRKRRSEVVDFDDEATNGSQKTANQKNLKDHDEQDQMTDTKSFTKRDETEDNSVPLADVIATSDVNSKHDQSDITKKNVIQHASNEMPLKDDVPSEEPSSNENDDEMDASNSSNSGMSNSLNFKKSSEFPKFLQGIIDEDAGGKGMENEVKKSHIESASPKPKSSAKTADDSTKKSKLNNVDKENSESKTKQTISAQSVSDSKNSEVSNHGNDDNDNDDNDDDDDDDNHDDDIHDDDNHDDDNHDDDNHDDDNDHEDSVQGKSAADTYAEFLRLSETPIVKHSSVAHVIDDPEMNVDAELSDSGKTSKLHESRDSMDTDEESLSGSESKEDKMGDTKVENETDSMESGDEVKSGKKSANMSDAKNQSKKDRTDESSSHKDQSETDDDSTPDDDDDASLDEDSSSDEEQETEEIDDTSERDSKTSEDDTMGSEGDTTGSEEDSMGSEKGSKGSKEDTTGSSEDASDSAKDSEGSQEDSVEDSVEDSGGAAANNTGLDSMATEKELKKVDESDSEAMADSGNKSVEESNTEVESNQSDHLLSDPSPVSDNGDDYATILKDFNAGSVEPDSVFGNGANTESKLGTGSNPKSQNNLKTYADSSKIDTNKNEESSRGDKDLEKNQDANANNAMDSGSNSGDSKVENTNPAQDNTAESNKANSNQNQINTDENQNILKSNSKDGQGTVSATMNDKEDTDAANSNSVSATTNEMDNKNTGKNQGDETSEKDSDNNKDNKAKPQESEKDLGNKENKEVKAEESGKIIDTSYRFNDEDSPDDDDDPDQVSGTSSDNEIWTSSSRAEALLNDDDTSDLAEAGITLDQNRNLQTQQPDDDKLESNLHINSNYEDVYNGQSAGLKQWGNGKMQQRQGSPQSNDYWLNGLANTQQSNLENIQDRQASYEGAVWGGKTYTSPYLGNGQLGGQGYPATEPPQLEKRTSIPNSKAAQSQNTPDGNKLPRNNPRKQNTQDQYNRYKQYKPSRHYTAPDALTDNDVQGYAGSIGPFLQKRNSVPQTLDENSEKTKKDDILESLVTDVKEPWIKHFLAKTLRMAVNGDKEILTSQQDGGQPLEAATRRDGVDEVDSQPKLSKVNDEQDDEMPLDATNNKDEDTSKYYVDEVDEKNYQESKPKETEGGKSEEQSESRTTHEDIPNMVPGPRLEGIPLSEVLKHVPQSPVADFGGIPSQGNGPLKSVIRITARLPLAQRIPNEYEAPPPQLPSSQMTPATPQLPPFIPPQQPQTELSEVPSDFGALVPNVPIPSETENKPPTLGQAINPIPSSPTAPAPKPGLTSSNHQPAPPAVGHIIKVIAAPGQKVTVKATYNPKGQVHDKGNTKIQLEINNALNNSVQNIGITSANNVLENTIKEAELLHVLKDAIPVNQRRPVGTDDDLKQSLEDLKDYAIALTEATGLSQAQRDAVAEKLARDLLDEMRVVEDRKQELLKELMAFVTAMEVSTVKERLNEIRSQVVEVSSQNPDDIGRVRSLAIRLLDELFEQLPLPKDQIKETEKKLGESKLLKSLVKAGEKRILRRKLKKALLDLVADKLL